MFDTYFPLVLHGNLSIDKTIIHVIILAISLYLTHRSTKVTKNTSVAIIKTGTNTPTVTDVINIMLLLSIVAKLKVVVSTPT